MQPESAHAEAAAPEPGRPAGTASQVGDALAREAARYAALGWMRATSGNLSVVVSRDPLRLAVTASGLDKSELTATDFVVVDGRGRPEQPGQPGGPEGTGRAASAEAPLHARIAALTGAGAIVHVHTVAAVLAAARWPDGLALAGLEMLKALGRSAEGGTVRLPVIANSQDMAALGNRVAAAREPNVPAVLVAAHGLYAWGADLYAARRHTEAVQWLVEWALAADALSRPT